MPTLRVAAVLGVLALLPVGPASAQRPATLKPTAYAITDARVVTAPGQMLEKATIVIRDGLIVTVAADAAVPPDAAIIDAKGLTVYPGFIDAGSPRGFDVSLRRSLGGPPAAEDLGADPLIATKPDHRRGLTPEFAVQSALKLDEDAVAPWRKVGFTSHLAMPDGAFFGGTSVLVSLSGAVPREAVIRGPVAQHAAFPRLAGNEYPTALMGMVAHCRQVLLDAGWSKRQWLAYEKAGRVGKRPVIDPCLEALWPLLDGTLPVAFEADSADQIHRALDFAAEFKLKPMIVGGRDAWKVAERLKAEGVPVILRLTFREPAEKEKDLPFRVQEDKQRLRKLEAGCAAALHKAGVPFAFATHGLSGDKPAEKFQANLRSVIEAGLPADAALAALTTTAAEILGAGQQLGRIAVGRTAHLLICDGDFHAAKTKIKSTFADGVRFEFDDAKEKPKEDAKPVAKKEKPKSGDGAESIAHRALFPLLDALEKVTTEIEADRVPKLKTGGDVLIRGATVLTAVGPMKPGTDVLVRGGKIAQIGENIKAPDNVKVIDASGMFLMPGIIDTHSHFAISGGVNEMTLSVVPEVRVRDVIDSEDVQIYRALAGGVTTARLLHGSANVIGGQDAVIKMKFGKTAKEMLVTSGPRGVKFALGENVKRTDGRFPNSRLGVEAVLIRAFTEANEYRKTRDAYAKDKSLPEPRRDLRLEALAEVLEGNIKVHCHCYRADEILMLLRVASQFGVKIQSLQHVLEGYKVASEIAAHGASVSLFSDWWAYKIEAFDAIPYAAKLLHDAGASVCLKSDDNELMRHLYQEAAKIVKYGGMAPDDALRTITLNPAKQLGLETRIGSIEVGKDADLALFDGHPLNAFSRCEMTFIEGEVYFQRAGTFAPKAIAAVPPPEKPVKFEPIPAADSYLIRGATIHSPGKPAFKGVVMVRGKTIEAVIPDGGPIQLGGYKVVTADDLHLYPGLIDAGTVLGLLEIESARETNDGNAGGDVQPDLRASVGINPDSELIPVTRANGVTTALTRPTGSLMGGQGVLFNLAGWVPAEMVVVDPIGLHVEYPPEVVRRRFVSNLPSLDGKDADVNAKKAREEKLRKLSDLFEQARRYAAAKKVTPTLPVNPRLEAMTPYLDKSKPVIIEANRKSEILAALKLADEWQVRMILSGGADAWKVAAELKKRDIPVILGPVMALPGEDGEKYDAPFTAAAKLHVAGVRFCLRSGVTSNARNLPYEAAMAISYGLPPEEGLKAVTTSPAQILGAGEFLGDIAKGMRGNLVITSGDILQPTTQVLSVFIDGKPYEPTNKQTRLYDKYRQRLNEVKSLANEGRPMP